MARDAAGAIGLVLLVWIWRPGRIGLYRPRQARDRRDCCDRQGRLRHLLTGPDLVLSCPSGTLAVSTVAPPLCSASCSWRRARFDPPLHQVLLRQSRDRNRAAGSGRRTIQSAATSATASWRSSASTNSWASSTTMGPRQRRMTAIKCWAGTERIARAGRGASQPGGRHRPARLQSRAGQGNHRAVRAPSCSLAGDAVAQYSSPVSASESGHGRNDPADRTAQTPTSRPQLRHQARLRFRRGLPLLACHGSDYLSRRAGGPAVRRPATVVSADADWDPRQAI